MIKRYFLILSLLAPLPLFAFHQGGFGRGEVTFEHRTFFKDHHIQNDDIKQLDQTYSLYTALDYSYRKNDWRFNFGAHGRVDSKDTERSYLSAQDLNVSYRFGARDSFSIIFGYQVFNWSVLDVFYPADIINSRNFDAPPDRLEKKGELALEVSSDFLTGSVSLYYFPRFQAAKLPSSDSRLAPPVSVDLGMAKVIDQQRVSDTRSFDQYGIRLYQYLYNIDLSFHYLSLIDRQNPLFAYTDYQDNPFHSLDPRLPAIIPLDDNDIRPIYFRTEQFGVTAQTPWGDGVVLRLEAVYNYFSSSHRSVLLAAPLLDGVSKVTRPRSHSVVAFGGEYTYGLFGGQELNFIAESTSTLGLNKQERHQQSVFQRDAALAIRYALNDVNSQEWQFSTIVDLERSKEALFNFSYQRRVWEDWRLDAGATWFEAKRVDSNFVGLEAFKDNQFFYLNLSYYF